MFLCNISILNKYGKQKLDEMLSPLKIEWRELVVMLVIKQAPGISQTHLIPFLQTDRANVTKLLQDMEKKEYIRREIDEADKRNKACYLTNQGNKLIPHIQEVLDLWESSCFKGLTNNEIQQFLKINEIITKNLI